MIKNYKQYIQVRNASWEILLDCQVHMLPVNVTKVCQCLDVRVLSYQGGKKIITRHGLEQLTKQTDGFTMLLYRTPIVFFDASCSRQRARFTIAHEIGHLVLGHVKYGRVTTINREPSPQDSLVETMANQFAARLLAPACVLWGLDVHKPMDIARLCDISLASATFRAERMKALYQRNKFLTSPLEQRVFQQFKPFIQSISSSNE